MGRGEPCCMLLRKSYVTPPVEMVVAWCSLGAGEGGAGERNWAIISFKIYQKAVITSKFQSHVISRQPAGPAERMVTSQWEQDET